MLFHVFDQVPHAFAGVVAGTVIMDIPKGSLNGISIGARRWQIEQFEAGMSSQPRLDSLGFMELRIIDHDGEVGKEWRGLRAIKCVEEFQEEARLLASGSWSRSG